MVYIRKKRKRAFFRAGVLFLALAFLIGAALRSVNSRLDAFIIPLARTGLTGEITRIINDAVLECLGTGAYGELVETVCDSGGRARSMRVDSLAVGLFRADVSLIIAESLSSLEKIYIEADLSNLFDDEILMGRWNFAFTVDVIFAGGVETDVKSEFISAGINQTNYRLVLTVAARVTADVVSAFNVDVATSVNLVDILIIGDVPTVVWG